MATSDIVHCGIHWNFVNSIARKLLKRFEQLTVPEDELIGEHSHQIKVNVTGAIKVCLYMHNPLQSEHVNPHSRWAVFAGGRMTRQIGTGIHFGHVDGIVINL